jgi:PGF-CTERM protein
MTIYGRSNNYSLNKSSTSSGFIVLHVPPPDAIYVTADPETILVGGDTSIITAQLYLNGQPYHRSNIKITFSSDNDTVATLPTVKTNVSDLNGQATIPLVSNKTIGRVNITAESNIMYGHNISNSTTVYVVGWGTVSGIVTDQNKVGIPYANVTLWIAKQNSTTAEQFDNQKILKIPENPQQSNDGRTAAVGMYTYYRVPWGLYNVTAEKEGHVWYAVFALGPNYITGAPSSMSGEIGTATHNIAIPDYAYMPPATPTPTITPTATAVVSAPATATPTATPTPGFEALFALAGLLGVAYMITRKEN